MDNSNKQAIVNAIWENPARVFGCEFKQSGKYWENLRGGEYDERGKIRLAQTSTGSNVMVFYNGGSRQEKTDVFTYLQDYVLHTAGFKETLIQAAGVYGITLEFSKEEREQLNRAALSREVAASLIQALQENPQGSTARYITEVRGLQLDGVHFGELTPESLNRATEHLRLRGLSYSREDLQALGLTEQNARNGYTCVLPYYRNGQIRGFVLRNTRPDANPRYLYSVGLGRGGYCDNLKQGEPVVMVEGQMDAIRLIQAGVPNVVAMGGAKISEDIAALLKSRNVSEVTYIPDREYNEQGIQKTNLIQEALAAFQSAKVDGERVINSLYIAELPEPEGVSLDGYKVDADTYGKEHGNDALADVPVFEARAWYDWELSRLLDWAREQDTTTGGVNINKFETRFRDIYNRCASPMEQQRLRNYITAKDVKTLFEAFGITPRSLDDTDEWNRNREYNNTVKDAARELSKAVEEQATPETIRGIVSRLSEAQTTNTRAEWDRQLNETFEDELQAIKEQPETLKTKWVLGNIAKGGQTPPHFVKYANIEFYPADIAVFCAPTSHGKTMILFQSALDAVQRTDKTYIYVSCEENKRQLIERALNVYLDIQATPDGKAENGGYCFIEQTRKKSIKAAIRGDVPNEYEAFMGHSAHFDNLSKQIQDGIRKYAAQIRPRLKFIHTDASAESICSNILRVVEEYREKGVEVGGVFVDYMQLLTTDSKQFSRHDELKDICKALKDCAARTELPVIIAAQLNRAVMDTQNGGIDGVTVANIGEGADIERIAHDIYLLWQVDKTNEQTYTSTGYPTKWDDKKQEYVPDKSKTKETYFDAGKMGLRARRIFARVEDLKAGTTYALKRGFMYIEQLKARDGKTGGWALLPYDGERGQIGETDKEAMI